MRFLHHTVRKILFYLPFCLFSSELFSQVNMDVLTEKFSFFSKARRDDQLFLHLDKTVYTNNEEILFCGYMVSEKDSVNDHQFLNLALVSGYNGTVYLQQKTEIRNGIAAGKMNIPDSIMPGIYQLVAYTNLLDTANIPLTFFTQLVTIKTITAQPYKVFLSLLDSQAVNGKIRVKVDFTAGSIGKNKAKPVIEYWTAGNDLRKVELGSQQSGIISVSESEINGRTPVLYVRITHATGIQYLEINLPPLIRQQQGINIRFFPEGGHIREGCENVIGWEAISADKRPAAVKAVLYKNDQAADTVETSHYGLGRFVIHAIAGDRYWLKIIGTIQQQDETRYPLPAIVSGGVVIQVKNAVVNDTLRFKLFSNTTGKFRMLIHTDYKYMYASSVLNVMKEGIQVAFPVSDMPRGIATITLLDSLGRPVAERLFFARYNGDTKLTITPLKNEYAKNETANVTIKLTDQSGNPLPGIFSVSCVQANRLEKDKRKDIESYIYLNNIVSSAYSREVFTDLQNMEDILLVKGWRKYVWMDMFNTTARDTSRYFSPLITGRVYQYGKRIKKQVDVSVFAGNIFNAHILTTDKTGEFVLRREDLLVGEGEVVFLSVNNGKKEDYTIEIDDPFIKINKALAQNLQLSSNLANVTQLPGQEQVLNDAGNAMMLSNVIVRSSVNKSIYGRKAKNSNECGDFVDAAGYLNWPGSFNSPGNRKPVKGVRYIDGLNYTNDEGVVVPYASAVPGRRFTVAFVIYEGCTTDKNKMMQTAGIYLSRQWYNEAVDDMAQLNFQSTLFWQTNMLVNEKGEANFSFRTGEIQGRYRIIVEGMGNKEVFSGESGFTVK